MTPNYACHLIFTADQEQVLKDYLIKCSAMCYGKSTRDLSDIKVPDSWHRDKKAGLEWMRSFLNRGGLSLRMPEGMFFVPYERQFRIPVKLLPKKV